MPARACVCVCVCVCVLGAGSAVEEVVSLIRCVGSFLDLKPAMVWFQALTSLGRWPLLLPAPESNSSNSVERGELGFT